MARPSAYPEWNSGGANNVDPGSSKRALGWVSGEKPVSSSSLNWWQKLVYEWLVHLDSDERTLIVPAAAAATDTPASYNGGLGTFGPAYLSNTSAAIVEYPVALDVGRRITGFRVYGREGNAAGELLTARLLRRAYDATSGVDSSEVIGGAKTSPDSSTDGPVTLEWTEADSGIPHVVEATYQYVIAVNLPATTTTGEVDVRFIEVDHDKAAPA